MSSKSFSSYVSKTILFDEDPSRSSNRFTSKCFEIENTLRECNIMVDNEACQNCHSLLKILKRKLKVDVAVITQFNINSVLFRLKDRRSSSKSVLIASDIEQDNKVDEVIREKFRGNIKSVFTSRIEYEYGQYGSLIALSSTTRESLTPDDLAILQDITRCIESLINYQGKSSTWSSSRSNLSLCSGLLGCLKPSLSDLTSIFYGIKESWDEMNRITLSSATPIGLRGGGGGNILERYKRRLLFKIERIELLLRDFSQTQKTVNNSVERILAVAKGYFLKDQETYIKTCSELVGIGLVEKINKTLKQLSQKLPSNSILWCFKVDTILAHAAHRTFYHHLTLFLENIIYYWSRYCSTTQMFICFEPIERNELPVRIPNVFSNPILNEHGENINDYTYVIEGYIKVLLQFPDKHNPKFHYSNDDASVGSHYTAQTKGTKNRPPGLTVNTKAHTYQSPMKSEVRTVEGTNNNRSPKHSPRSINSKGGGSVASKQSNKSTSILQRFRLSLKPDDESVGGERPAAHQSSPTKTNLIVEGNEEGNEDENDDEFDEDDDDFDPDHPVHHIEPLLGLLNSSLLRLNEISTAKSVNIMSESSKNQADEAYFIRIPCLLYLTSAMDTSFLQYHGYKYNDFRFQKKKKKNNGDGKGNGNASSKKQHPRDRPLSARKADAAAAAAAAAAGGGDKQSSKKLVRKNSRQRMDPNGTNTVAVTKRRHGFFAVIRRFLCLSSRKKNNQTKMKRGRAATTRFPPPKKEGDPQNPVIISPSNSSDVVPAKRR